MGLEILERSVIGATLISNGQHLDEYGLIAADFYEYHHQTIWQRILDNKNTGLPCDPITLISQLPDKADLVWRCVDVCYSVESALGQAQQIKTAANKRRLLIVAEQALAVDQPLDEMVKAFGETLTSVEKTDNSVFEKISDYAIDYIGEKKTANTNAKSGIRKIDELLQGFRPGALYVIGARPGIGKTVVGLQFALGLGRIGNELSADEKPGLVLFHSLEMSKREIMNRLMAQVTAEMADQKAKVELNGRTFSVWPVGMDVLDAGNLSPENEAILWKATERLSRPLVVNDKGGQSIASIRAYARAMSRTMPLRAIVVDYLGLISDANEYRNRYEGITFVSNQLKRLAMDFNVPVIALAQLNRNSDGRQPSMADLRDSGAVEQDADVVILLHRDPKDKNPETAGTITLDVVKNRHGATDYFTYLFIGSQARIKSYENP